MAMIRACSYTATIQTPQDPEEYSAILCTFSQNGNIIVEKDETEITIDDNTVIIQLDQDETKLFECGKKCFLQIRCYKEQYVAPGSSIWAISVYPALNDETLPIEEEEEESGT